MNTIFSFGGICEQRIVLRILAGTRGSRFQHIPAFSRIVDSLKRKEIRKESLREGAGALWRFELPRRAGPVGSHRSPAGLRRSAACNQSRAPGLGDALASAVVSPPGATLLPSQRTASRPNVRQKKRGYCSLNTRFFNLSVAFVTRKGLSTIYWYKDEYFTKNHFGKWIGLTNKPDEIRERESFGQSAALACSRPA